MTSAPDGVRRGVRAAGKCDTRSQGSDEISGPQENNFSEPVATDELRAISYHEAGHVVMSYYFGIRISSVSIIPDDESRGRVINFTASVKKFQEACDKTEWNSHPDNYDEIIQAFFMGRFAGPAAEARFTGRPYAGLLIDQREDYLYPILLMHDHLSDDIDTIWCYTNLMLYLTWVVILDPVVWGAIERVAAALLQEQKITGRKVEHLLPDILTLRKDIETQG